jgi:uncharacterized membrane protein
VVLYLILAIETITDANHIRTTTHLYDEGRLTIPVLTATAALASIGAIFDLLTTAPAGHHLLNLGFCHDDNPALMELETSHLRFPLRARVLCRAPRTSLRNWNYWTSVRCDGELEGSKNAFVFNLTLFALAVNLAASSTGSLSAF